MRIGQSARYLSSDDDYIYCTRIGEFIPAVIWCVSQHIPQLCYLLSSSLNPPEPPVGVLAGLLSPADLEDGRLDTVVWYPVGRYAVYPKQVCSG